MDLERMRSAGDFHWLEFSQCIETVGWVTGRASSM